MRRMIVILIAMLLGLSMFTGSRTFAQETAADDLETIYGVVQDISKYLCESWSDCTGK